MNIASTQYSLSHSSFEIYLAGCDGLCKGCHNPELWNFNLGKDYLLWYPSIENKMTMFNDLIEYIWLLGGEPLLQNMDNLMELVEWLSRFDKKIVLWTRFDLDEIPDELTKYLWAAKVGEYREDLACDDYYSNNIKLASVNQKFVLLNTKNCQ